MNVKKVMEILKNDFELKENHIKILECLIHGPATADEICSKTAIPKGRIYEFVNNLLLMQLVSKKDVTPTLYTVKDFKASVYKFIQFNVEDLARKETKIAPLTARPELVPITNRREGAYLLKDTLETNKNFRVINHAAPYFFYPEDDAGFVKLRQAIVAFRETISGNDQNTLLLKNAYFNAYHANKKFKYISRRSRLDDHIGICLKVLGKKKTKQLLRTIMERLKKFSIESYVSKGRPIMPWSLYIFDEGVSIAFIFGDIIDGLMIRSKKAAETYAKSFDDAFKTATPMKAYLKKKIADF